MPNLTQYYLDATNLSLATCVFTDPDLTIIAPQGYYGDGAIIRYQTVQGAPPFGTLGPANNSYGGDSLNCPSCVAPCLADESSLSQAIRIEANFNNLATDLSGNFRIPLSLGEGPNTVGAIICRVYFRNQYGAGCGLLLDNENSVGLISTSFNNFSASGSTPNVIPYQYNQGGFPHLGANDGGYQRGLYIQPDGTFNYGGSVADGGYVLTDDFKFLYVGGATRTIAGPNLESIYYDYTVAPCTTLNFLQVPNNKPNYDAFSILTCPECPGTGVPAPSIPAIANPQVHPNMPKWTWQNNGGTYEWVLSAVTDTIQVDQEQVQIGNLTQNGNYSDADGGYRGWFTGALPKTDPNMQLAYMKLQSLACGAQGANGLSIVVNVNCPRILDPIYYEPANAYCTQPQENQIDAFTNGTMDTQIFNVPGAEGISPNFPLYEPVTIYDFGVPNRHDLVFYDAYAETPVNPTDTPMWCKYIDPNGDPKLFEVRNGIITQTDVVYVPEPASCGDIIQTTSNAIGGGIYIAEAETGAATGAIIVRIFTGQNPKGLYTKLIDTDGTTVVTRNNSFAVRGSTNEAGDLTEAQYIEDSDSPTIYNTGAPAGGSGYTLMGTQIDPTTVYEEGTGNASTTRTVSLYDSYCNESGNGQWGQLVYGEIPDVFNQYGNLYPDGDISHFELPIYIGSLNTNDSPISATPCIQHEPSANITFTQCQVGFNPEGISSGVYNPLGNINLPENFPHQYTGVYGTGGDDEGIPSETLWNNCVIEIVTGDEFYPLYTYPFTTTGCTDNCLYPLWYYDGAAGQYIQSSVYYQIGVASPQVQLYQGTGSDTTIDSPGWIMGVIPKLTAAEQKIRVEVMSITSNTKFTVRIDCPTALTSINGGIVHKASTLNGSNSSAINQLCVSVPASNPPLPCFIAHNAYGGENDNPQLATEAPCVPGEAGSGVCSGAAAVEDTIPYINDMVFQDANGEVPLEAGFYYYERPGPVKAWFEVDEFGVVRCSRNCGTYDPCNY